MTTRSRAPTPPDLTPVRQPTAIIDPPRVEDPVLGDPAALGNAEMQERLRAAQAPPPPGQPGRQPTMVVEPPRPGEIEAQPPLAQGPRQPTVIVDPPGPGDVETGAPAAGPPRAWADLTQAERDAATARRWAMVHEIAPRTNAPSVTAVPTGWQGRWSAFQAEFDAFAPQLEASRTDPVLMARRQQMFAQAQVLFSEVAQCGNSGQGLNNLASAGHPEAVELLQAMERSGRVSDRLRVPMMDPVVGPPSALAPTTVALPRLRPDLVPTAIAPQMASTGPTPAPSVGPPTARAPTTVLPRLPPGAVPTAIAPSIASTRPTLPGLGPTGLGPPTARAPTTVAPRLPPGAAPTAIAPSTAPGWAAPLEAPTVPMQAPSALSRVMGAVGTVSAARSVVDGVREVNHARELSRRGDPEGAINHGVAGGMNATSGALSLAGTGASLAGATGVGAAMTTAAMPIAAGATVIAADRAGDEAARRSGQLGERDGYTASRGIGRPRAPVNRDFGDDAVDAGRRVEGITGSTVAGGITAGVARVGLLPVAATYGIRQTLGNSGGRTNVTDLQAEAEEERGVPIEQATPEVRRHREGLRATRQATADAQRRAGEEAARARDAEVGLVRPRPGSSAAAGPITDTQVRVRAQIIQRRWALERGEVAPRLDLGEMERAEVSARAELDAEHGDPAGR